LAAGVYVTLAVQLDPPPLGRQLVAEIDPKLPCVGAVTIANDREALSTSEADNVITAAVSSAVVTLWGLETGASLSAVTVRLAVAVLEFKIPSFVRKVKLSDPV
jgi:hypothetical protein